MATNIEFFPSVLQTSSTVVAGSAFNFKNNDAYSRDNATFQANGITTAGTGSATIDIEVSNNESDWIIMGTITLTLGTTSTSDGFASSSAWAFVRSNVTAISGTGATVTVTIGV